MKSPTPPRFILLVTLLLGLGWTAACTSQQLSPTLTLPALVTATRTPIPPTSTFPPSPTATSTPTPLPSPTPTQTATLPTRVEIEGVPGQSQRYALSCEANAATQLAAYFGLPLSQRDFQSALPLSDNPETGFVGQVEGAWGQVPPNAYGVHAAPVAKLLRDYGLNAQAHEHFSIQKIRHEIAAGRPVVVWVIGGVRAGRPMAYTAADGSILTVAPYQHTVVVTGYGPDYLTFLDGNQTYFRSIQQFADSWKVLGNMAITVADPPLLSDPEP